MSVQNFGTTKVPILGFPLRSLAWESQGKVTFGCNPRGEAQSIL